MQLTAAEISKTIRTGRYKRYAYKALYVLFGRKVLTALDPKTDKRLRDNARYHSAGWWASVPAKTLLRFNVDVTVICSKDKHEARKIQNFLANITREDGFTDFTKAEELHFTIRKELRNTIIFEKKIKMCLNSAVYPLAFESDHFLRDHPIVSGWMSGCRHFFADSP